MKLSIILPCYNVAPYLERCLTSLSNQELQDIEIICIDDKSTDNTLELLKMYAKRDLRIRVVENNTNCGVGYTRNRGIDLATGDFVAFVDPDDWVDSNFFSKLVKAAEKHLIPIVCADVIEHDIDGKTNKIKRDIKTNHHEFRYHYSAIYLRDLLNKYNLCYPNLCIGEDTVFEARVKCIMPKPIKYISGTAYHYCRRSNSLNSYCWSEKQIDDYIIALNNIIDTYNIYDHVDKQGYLSGAQRYFLYFCCTLFFRNNALQDKIAMASIQIFNKLKYSDEILKRNRLLFMALSSQDINAVKDVLVSQQSHVRAYYLFGCFKVATVTQNRFKRLLKIFGIPVWGSLIE